MAPGNGNFEGALGVGLAFDISKINVLAVDGLGQSAASARGGCQRTNSSKYLDRLTQRGHGDHLKALHEGGFMRIVGRHQETPVTVAECQGDGQDTWDRTYTPVEGQFSQHDSSSELGGI